MKIPISTKLISVTILTVVASTASITLISSEYFEKKSSEQIDISNLEVAAGKTKEINNIVASLVDKTRIIGSVLLKTSQRSSNSTSISPSISPIAKTAVSNNLTPSSGLSGLSDSQQQASISDEENKYLNDELNFNFNKDKNFVALEVLKLNGTSVESIGRKVKEEVFRSHNLTSAFLSEIRAQQNFPIRNLALGNIEIKNASYAKGPALFTIGLPLVRDAQGKITHVVIADISLAPLEKPFTDPSERTQYLIDKSGELLAHKDENKAFARLNMKTHPFVQKSLAQNSSQFQTKFFDPATKSHYFGAAVATSFGATLISETSEESILEVSNEVKRRSIFVAGSAISLAIFFIFLFSMTLTSPIEKLAELINLVSKGNFDVHARRHVRSNDEVGELAEAFDHMTEGLKERDKVKNLFSKFHGVSIAEDLISKDISVGGQSKDVVVFFSDIRGFTAYSEKRTPEEVVEMLNEYFAVMVSLINSHGGVVDKFIGDAIMAVWGAPQGTDKDALNAVRACLEMRLALEKLNEKRIARGQPAIQIGMGLHAGKAISGTIGSNERMEYTVIGNTVNTASRIEASTKAFGADLLITDTVIDKIGDNFLVDLAGEAEVKGRSEAIKMYKVRGYREDDGTYKEIKTLYSDYEAEGADKVKVKSAG